MSNWRVDADGVLNIWDYDCNSVQLFMRPYEDGFILELEGEEEIGNFGQSEKHKFHLGLFGRQLNAFRGFLMEPIQNNVLAENGRLHALLQHIKYGAKGLSGDFEDVKDSPLALWLCEQITDKDAGW
jgi:hypothetical protein